MSRYSKPRRFSGPPPLMPAFATKRGNLIPQMTHHFIERHAERFPTIELGHVPKHVAKAMVRSVVISGLPGQVEGDYYLWDRSQDRIMVMKDYMGVLLTCYKASKSVWFKESGAESMSWPSFVETFGEVANEWDTMTPGKKEAIIKKQEKQRQEEELKYLEWYESKTNVNQAEGQT